MKYCDKCNKVYEDNARFCPTCGGELKEPERYDIFGEKLNETKKPEVTEQVIDNDEIRIDGKYYGSHASEIFSILSIAGFLIPFSGTIISFLGIVTSAGKIKYNKKEIIYFIISLVSFILSLLYIFVLYKYGVFNQIIQEIMENSAS